MSHDHALLVNNHLIVAKTPRSDTTDLLLSSPTSTDPCSLHEDNVSGPSSPGSCVGTPTIAPEDGGTGVFIPAANPAATPRGSRRNRRRNTNHRRTTSTTNTSTTILAAQFAATQSQLLTTASAPPSLLSLLHQLALQDAAAQLSCASPPPPPALPPLDLSTLSTFHSLHNTPPLQVHQPLAKSPLLMHPTLQHGPAMLLDEALASSPASAATHSSSGWVVPDALATCMAGLQLQQAYDAATWTGQQDSVWQPMHTEPPQPHAAGVQQAVQLPDSWSY